MLNRFIFLLAVILTTSLIANAQNAAQTPDFSGVWLQSEEQGGGTFVDDYPMQPWVKELFDYAQDPTGTTRNEMDPNISKCFPRGPTSNWLGGNRPFEIFHVRNRVLILFEWNSEIRQIFTDGRGHPKELAPTWMGHSVGRWEGDTLVIDTIGINEHTWLDRDGHVHSNQLHLTERIRRPSKDMLTLDITFEDPKAYTKPFSSHRVFQLAPPNWEIEEHVLCEDKLLGKPITVY